MSNIDEVDWGKNVHPFSYDRLDNGDFIEVFNPNENIYYEAVLEAENRLTVICFTLDNTSVLKSHTEEDLFRIGLKFTYGKRWEYSEWERIGGSDEQYCGSDLTLFNHPFTDININLWPQDTYRINYIVDDNLYAEVDVKPNSSIEPLEVPEKEGYTFSGWESLPATMPPYDINIYGHYDINYYRLTFIIGEDILEVWDVAYGSEIGLPYVEEREGYTFDCWEGLPETMPAHDVTVYGLFKANSYTLRFVIDDEVISEQTLEFGSAIVSPEAPEKEGYTFNGWEWYPETMPSHDMTIWGSYRINSYKLTYVIDGNTIEEFEIEYGAETPEIGAPEREGYTFNGWSECPETMPGHDVTVTGSYSINTYTLIFKIDEEVVSEETVEFGSEIVVPETPEKEGYTFNGWEEFPETMPSHDLTVNGSFRINSFLLTFKIGDEIIFEEEREYGSEINAPEAPEREGYTFNGWSEYPETMPSHDVIVEGSYTVNTYTLIFKIDNEIISEQNIEYGSEIESPEAPEKEGYTFKGWEEYPETMPSNDVTVNGSYSVNSYKLTFVIDGNVVEEKEIEYGTALEPIDAPVKEGYTFSGWSGLPKTMPAQDVTAVGSYTINSYRLVFKVGNDIIYEAVVEYGSEIVEPEAPEKEGYSFAGWDEYPETMPAHELIINGHYEGNSYKLTYMIDGEVIAVVEVEFEANIDDFEAPEKEGHTFNGWEGLPETMPGHDVTVTGSYTINSYNLIFKVGDEVISESVVEYGSDIDAPEAPEKEGCTFSGWDEHPETMPAYDLTVNGYYDINYYKLTFLIDGEVIFETEVEYMDSVEDIEAPEKEGYTFNGWEGLPETMPGHDVTVTGSYTINSYTLTFKVGDEVIRESVVEYGSDIEAPEAPEKEGYTFNEWVGMPETMPAHDVTVNASYTVNTYTITFIAEWNVVSEQTLEYGAEIIAPEAPEIEGYTFIQWDEYPETMPAEDLVIYGNYIVNVYTVTYIIDDEVIRVDYVDYGAELPDAPDAPEKEDYDFVGWSEIPDTMPAYDITIYGSYEYNAGLSSILQDSVKVDIFDIQGRMIKKDVDPERISDYVPSGVYIINHTKVLIK